MSLISCLPCSQNFNPYFAEQYPQLSEQKGGQVGDKSGMYALQILTCKNALFHPHAQLVA